VRGMRIKRSYLVIAVLIVAVVGLFVYEAQDTARPAPVPKTSLTGKVSSVQPNSNFSVIFFLDLKTRVTYGAAIRDSTGSISLCRTSPCTYSISLLSDETYNATIEVIITTTLNGNRVPYAQDCPATHLPDNATQFSPTGDTQQSDFKCNTAYPTS